MEHIVLLGDSIFDNAAYVPTGEPVIRQLQSRLDRGSKATLLARDGATVANVANQLRALPADATHLVLSVGGNNALGYSYLLDGATESPVELLRELAIAQRDFALEYREMLLLIQKLRRPTLICTVYDAIPGLAPDARMALSIFNDIIIRHCIDARLPVLDLRFVCDDFRYYSEISPIEPSEAGGSNITRAILRVLKSHDFNRPETVIYR